MQPLKITIFGDYWDCQIYMGRLYLWTINGDLQVYNWDEIVNSLIESPEDSLALNCAFTKGNYLYGSYLSDIFDDSEFKELLFRKFTRLDNKSYELNQDNIRNYLYGTQGNPFDELPTDTEIFNKKLYAATDSGFWVGSAHRSNRKYPVSSKPTKLWDCPLVSIKANKYSQFALSGGSEGLFEFNSNDLTEHIAEGENSPISEVENNIFQISKKHSLFSNYSFLSIYNSSNVTDSFMAVFQWFVRENHNHEVFERMYKENISDSRIFSTINRGISWGGGDKIYKAQDGRVEIVEFNNYASDIDEETYFYKKRTIDLHSWKGEVVCGGVAYFGTLIECENALVVSLSDGSNLTINGPVTRWRVYPRSKNYENHLHVILDDRIEIYSFNNDYFIDQSSKNFGMTYQERKNRNYKASL
jgi:hypothetical protein